MKPAPDHALSVARYIQGFPTETRRVLRLLRDAIRQVAPDAEESISYRIPAYKVGKTPLVYFAGFDKHVSVYPATEAAVAALPKLAAHRSGRGTLKFPLDQPVPVALVKQFVRLRLKEARQRVKDRPRS